MGARSKDCCKFTTAAFDLLPVNGNFFVQLGLALLQLPDLVSQCLTALYSGSIRDMIDHSLYSCVERSVTVRYHKNCGSWFLQTGWVSFLPTFLVAATFISFSDGSPTRPP